MSVEQTEAADPTECLTVDTRALLTWADCIRHLVDEARIEVTDQQLQTVMRDPANVAVVEATLTPAAIEGHYEPTTVGLPLVRFTELVQALSTRKVDVAFTGGEKPTAELATDTEHVTVDCIREDHIRSEPDMSKVEWGGSLTVSAAELRGAVELFDAINASGIWFEADPDAETLILTPQSDDQDVTVTLDPDDMDGLEAGSSLFSTLYLAPLVRSFDGDCEIELELKDEFPLRATFSPRTGVEVQFIQAPRIQR